MSLSDKFATAAKDVQNLATQPTQAELLELYAYFKQSEVGDVNTSRPGMLDLKGKAKWDAWNSKKGTSQDEAKEKYIALAESLKEKYGTK